MMTMNVILMKSQEEIYEMFPSSPSDQDQGESTVSTQNDNMEVDTEVGRLPVSDEEVPEIAMEVEIEGPPVQPPISARDVQWRRGNFVSKEDQIKFRGNDRLPEEITRLQTPYQFCTYFFTQEMKRKIVEETIRYSVQLDPSKPLPLSMVDLDKFLGICLLMSVVHLPNSRYYWHSLIGNESVINTMGVNHIEEIERFLHFNDNDKAVPPNLPSPNHMLFHIRNDSFLGHFWTLGRLKLKK
uniref:PiggyBac transposable element-derived protein domain-containing protein n=1 Tax=Cacopsylla melanoneura TaxID=428564 RepID=A0A8D8ZG94_9HEMI